MRGIIYKYTSTITNKSYIGQTVSPERRKSRHRCSMANDHFHNAIRKYGFDTFIYEVLATVDNDSLDYVKSRLNWLEKYYIKKYDTYRNGYNSTAGGEGTVGYSHPQSEEVRKRIGESRKGIKFSDSHKQKLSEAKVGKKLQPEVYKAQAEKRQKKVLCIETQQLFDSRLEAATFAGKAPSMITRAVKLGLPCGGYHWKYVA